MSRIRNSVFVLVTLVVPLGTAFIQEARGGIIVLRSGNGTIGSTDSKISMLVGPADSPFGTPFTGADFAAARSGPAASIVSPHMDWLSSLPADPLAQWISTDPRGADPQGDPFGRTALYAIDFDINEPFDSATLELFFAVDNRLGDLDQDGMSNGPNDGIFINGTAISGSYRDGNFFGQFFVFRSDIGPLLQPGTNTLFLNAVDIGGPSGLIFSAQITTTAVPEPSSLAIFVLGIALILGPSAFQKRPLAC